MPSALLIVAGLAGLLTRDCSSAAARRRGHRLRAVGSPGPAVGNIVGTNLVNILFILGLSASIRPIAFERRTLRFDLPAMTGASLSSTGRSTSPVPLAGRSDHRAHGDRDRHLRAR